MAFSYNYILVKIEENFRVNIMVLQVVTQRCLFFM